MEKLTHRRRPHAEIEHLTDTVKRIAHPLHDGELQGYDPLLDLVGDARIVLLGEASHGTHEFYRERARITTRLIREREFTMVAIEGDWPEAHRVNQFVQGGTGTAEDALSVFTVYPTWMWANLDALHFIQWLRRYNDELPEGGRPVGFYGLDLYSLRASADAVIRYLQSADPEAAERATERYGCFDPYESKDAYASSTGLGLSEGCEREAIAMLRDLCSERSKLVERSSEDDYFFAEMAAAATRDGERYYRSMYRADEVSWNVRDIHMADTLDALLDHFGPSGKVVVWEHNTHIGDFRATADAGHMVNVGQLVRQRHPGESIAVGFGTYTGAVTASRYWGGQPEHMTVPAAVSGSFDNAFHESDFERFLLLLKPLRERGEADGLNDWRGQRAIGVVYHPEREFGNYVPTRLADRYDAYIHIDRTRAVKPLGIEPMWTAPPAGDTYPSGY